MQVRYPRSIRPAHALVAAALLAGGEAAHGQGAGKAVFSVKVAHPPFPAAVGDGMNDDTSAIQGTIAYASLAANRGGNGAVIFFPEGRYRVTSTILTGDVSGMDFAGASAHAVGAAVSGTWDPVTSASIVADFPAGAPSPLFYSQASYSRWSDLCLVGRLKKTSVTPSALIETHTSSINCVGSVGFENVLFVNSQDVLMLDELGIGVSLGLTEDDHCNSEFTFHRCGFGKLATGVKVNTVQGVDYVFQQVSASHCKTFLDLAEGGNVSFDTGTFTTCGGEGAGDWIFKIGNGGVNNGTAKILNARFESGCVKLVRVDGEHNVLVENLLETPPNTGAAPLEVGGGSVVFSNCRLASFPVLNFVTPVHPWLSSTVRFRDCTLPVAGPGVFPPPPVPPAPPPGTIITGVLTGQYVFEHCGGIYTGATFYPLAHSTNVTGW